MILGIESSCDDSSIAIMNEKNFELVCYEKITQEDEHYKFGGVVPELAARLHAKILPDLLLKIKDYFCDLKAVAVCHEPGLSVSLISGVSMAKTISVALNIPLIGINHLIGHIYSLFLDSQVKLPLGVLLVSGGHTMILNIDENKKIDILASSNDDSFGESFDKVAKMLGFGYPGGVIIEKMATNGQKDAFNFTMPLKNRHRLEYSFSGLKNQVRLEISRMQKTQKNIADLCACFQYTAISHILDKLKICFEKYNFKYFGIVGGASANQVLRNAISELCKLHEVTLLMAPLKFCSDNAAMIARAGIDKYKNKIFSDLDLEIRPKTNIQGIFLDK